MKLCRKCNNEKDDIDFHKNQRWCKSCNKQYKIANGANKKYYLNHKNKIDKRNKSYNLSHKDEIKKQRKQYYQANKQYIGEQKRKYNKRRRSVDPFFKIRNYVSKQIWCVLKKNNSNKNKLSITKFIDVKKLFSHIESQFEPWMNWDNYGKYDLNTWDENNSNTWTWQLDHIIPQSDLPYVSMEDDNFKKCWNLSNLRPYSSKLNVLDGTNRIRHN